VLIVTLKANGKQQESVLCFGNSAHVELVTALETDIHHYKTWNPQGKRKAKIIPGDTTSQQT